MQLKGHSIVINQPATVTSFIQEKNSHQFNSEWQKKESRKNWIRKTSHTRTLFSFCELCGAVFYHIGSRSVDENRHAHTFRFLFIHLFVFISGMHTCSRAAHNFDGVFIVAFGQMWVTGDERLSDNKLCGSFPLSQRAIIFNNNSLFGIYITLNTYYAVDVISNIHTLSATRTSYRNESKYIVTLISFLLIQCDDYSIYNNTLRVMCEL